MKNNNKNDIKDMMSYINTGKEAKAKKILEKIIKNKTEERIRNILKNSN